MPLEEEEEGDGEEGVGGKGSSEDAADPEQGTPAAANGRGLVADGGAASAEVRRQMSLTRDWLRMVCLHAACEVLPLFLLVTFDLPQVVGGLGTRLVPVEVAAVLYHFLHLMSVAKCALSTTFFFYGEVAVVAGAAVTRIKAMKK